MPMFARSPPRRRPVPKRPVNNALNNPKTTPGNRVDPLYNPSRQSKEKSRPIKDGDSRNTAYGASRKNLQQTKYWRP